MKPRHRAYNRMVELMRTTYFPPEARDAVETELERLYETIDEADREALRDLRADLDEAEAHADEAEEQADEARAEVEELERQLEDLREQLDTQKEHGRILEGEVENLKDENSALHRAIARSAGR